MWPQTVAILWSGQKRTFASLSFVPGMLAFDCEFLLRIEVFLPLEHINNYVLLHFYSLVRKRKAAPNPPKLCVLRLCGRRDGSAQGLDWGLIKLLVHFENLSLKTMKLSLS